MSDGRFKKGHKTWNKGLKGLRVSPETEFKEGQIVGDKHPQWKGGINVMSKDCVHIWVGKETRVRRPRVVYERAYGKIPKGYVIYHKDGDRHNDDIDNLVAISRSELMKKNSTGKTK